MSFKASHLATLFCLALFSAPLGAANWQQVWSDEFNGPANTSPDGRWWSFTTGGNMPNNELECYTSSTNNCRMDGNGNLIIEARNEAACNGRNYTSARIESNGKFGVMWGKVEVRAKIPSFQGSWPAFWMMGDNIGSVGWPACGEIDILETVNVRPQWIQSSLHAPGDPYNWDGQSWLGAGQAYSDDYHIFGCEWNSTTITFTRDGAPFYTLNSWQVAGNQWPYNQQNFLLLNLAVGGSWPGNPNGGVGFPAQYVIDYVRVYKDKDLKQAYNNAPQQVPGRVEAEKYDDGGYGLSYMDTEPANRSGAFRPNEWVDIEAQGGASGGFNVDYTQAGEWMEYTVNATQTGSYSMRASVASGGGGGTFHINVDGVNATGPLQIPDTGAWTTWGDVIANNIFMTAGTHVLRLVEDSNGSSGSVGNFDYMDFWIPAATATPTFTKIPTQTPLPTLTWTKTFTPLPTKSYTLTVSPTPQPSLTDTKTNTPLSTPSFSASVTPVQTQSFSQSPTPSATPWSSPMPSSSATVTGTKTAAVTPAATARTTPASSPSASPAFSASMTASATPQPSSLPSKTAIATPGASALPSKTGTPTPGSSQTATSTLSLSPSATPSPLKTATPSATVTASATLAIPETGTFTQSPTATSSPARTFTSTPTSTSTPTTRPTALATSSATRTTTVVTEPTSQATLAHHGHCEIEEAAAVPNPNPRRIAIKLSAAAESVSVEFFSKAMVLSARAESGPRPQGWSEIELPQGAAQLGSGLYYARLIARNGGDRSAPRICKLLILK